MAAPQPDPIEALLQAESDLPLVWWLLRYGEGRSFRGVLILRARGLTHALLQASWLNLSPGGSVTGFPIPEEVALPPVPYRYRLLTRAELDACWDGMEPDPAEEVS